MWQRAGALALMLMAAGFYSYLIGRPMVTARVGEQDWALKPGETLAMTLPGAAGDGDVLRLTGPVGRNVLVAVPRGAFGPKPPPEITMADPQLAGQNLDITWHMGEGGHSRAMVEVRVRPVGTRRPQLVLRPRVDPNVAELQFVVRDAEMHMMLTGVATGADAAPALLTVGDPGADPMEMSIGGGGALPIPVIVPPNGEATIRYAESAAAGAAGATYALTSDAPGAPGGLVVTALRIERAGAANDGSADLQEERLYACGGGSNSGGPGGWLGGLRKIAWVRGIHQIDCRPTLALAGLELGTNGLVARVNGEGFVAANGVTSRFTWEFVKTNPILMAFLGGIPGAIGLWAYRKVFAPLGRGWPRRTGRPVGAARLRRAGPSEGRGTQA
jgi:hypothetical protein